MAAYFLLPEYDQQRRAYQRYREAVVPLIMKYGGKVLIKGGKVEPLEGKPDGQPMVAFEFPSIAAIHAFWNSPEYVPVKALRKGAAALNVWAVPGIRAKPLPINIGTIAASRGNQ